jgi:hypothetical protein
VNAITAVMDAITKPARLWSRDEVCSRPSPVPADPGIYGWFFRELPYPFDVSGCAVAQGSTLLYTGIAPRQRARPSRQTLRTRLRSHYAGNAEASTLRLTLGCLLQPRLGLILRRSAGGHTFTFGGGERMLTEWMAENALVVWFPLATPWDAEQVLVGTLDLPLNLEMNAAHPFHPVLSRLRHDARQLARSAPPGPATGG